MNMLKKIQADPDKFVGIVCLLVGLVVIDMMRWGLV